MSGETGFPHLAEVESLIERMEGHALPDPPCPVPETPLGLGAWILQNEGLTMYGEMLLGRLVHMAESGGQE